jgi:hypothetical protein
MPCLFWQLLRRQRLAMEGLCRDVTDVTRTLAKTEKTMGPACWQQAQAFLAHVQQQEGVCGDQMPTGKVTTWPAFLCYPGLQWWSHDVVGSEPR